MAPGMMPKMAISQEGFDAAVKENMEDFDMDLAEAVQDAVKTFQIQGADLSDFDFTNRMEQFGLPKAIYNNMKMKVVDSLLVKSDKKDVQPSETRDDKLEVVEPPLAKNDNQVDVELLSPKYDVEFEPPVANNDSETDFEHPLPKGVKDVKPPLLEIEIKQPPVFENDKVNDAEAPPEKEENSEKVEDLLAKDSNLEQTLTKLGNSEQSGPSMTRNDTMDVLPSPANPDSTEQVQLPLAEDDNKLLVETPLAIDEDIATAGIVTDGSNIGKEDYVHPVVQALKELDKTLLLLRLEDGSYINWEDKQAEPGRVESLFEAAVEALEKVSKLCTKTEIENAQIAVKYGGVEAIIQTYYALQTYRMSWGSVAFRVLFNLITEEQGKEVFLKANGPKVVLEALAMENVELYDPMNRELSCIAANVLALAAAKNETVKERFMELGADEKLVKYLKNHAEEMGADGAALQAACDAIRSLTVADDDRPAASNAFKNAMKIAKAGAMDAFLEILPQKSKALPILPSLCMALKSLAVNDEICKSFAEEGGLNLVLEFLDYACKYPNKIVGRTSLALLTQLAGSDANKEAIVKSGGLEKIIHLMKIYNEEPSVLQEGFAAITTLTLRSPQHVTKAVEAGALDLAAELMKAHSDAPNMLRQACQMVRNLNVRNPENRPVSLEKGLEPLLRRAKDTHEICKDVGSAALRDLGLEDYL